MLDVEQYRLDLSSIRATIDEVGAALNIPLLKEQFAEYQEDMSSEGFWDNMERAQKINRKAHVTEQKLNHFAHLNSRADDLETLVDLAEEADDNSMAEEIREEFRGLNEEVQQLRLTTLLRDEYDGCDAILALHAGAGGTEAQDWTQMLYRMYVHFAERMGFTLKELDMLDGDEAGIKSVTFEVSGDNAYGFLKSERGVHRLVRISPFDANARRHTSFASLDVAPVIEEDASLEIRPEEIRIDTYRASGAGGQHVNRTDSAVRITHLATGIVVQCQNERSQIQNRETCFKMLRAKLAERREQERQALLENVKGEMKKIEWGSQIRSYVFQPYTMVKDHRTGYEVGDISGVMDGDLEGFVTAYLQKL